MNEIDRGEGTYNDSPSQQNQEDRGATRGYPTQQQQPPYSPPTPYGQPPQPPAGPQQSPSQPYGAQPPPYYSLTSTSTPNQGAPAAGQMGNERLILAAILIGAGFFFFIQQFTPFSFGDFVMPVVGGAFIAAYVSTRAAYRVGFLIPGSILLGIGLGNLLEDYTPLGQLNMLDISGLMLGLGFCLIWALERRQWWALIPGGILVTSSLADFWMLTKLWPLALVILGAYLLYDQYRRRQKS